MTNIKAYRVVTNKNRYQFKSIEMLYTHILDYLNSGKQTINEIRTSISYPNNIGKIWIFKGNGEKCRKQEINSRKSYLKK